MNSRLLICALGLSLLLTSCAGYQLGGQKPAHLSSVTKLAVPSFENLSLEPRLGALVTNAVIKQIQLNGSYQIVEEADADAVLTGRIVRIRRSQFRSDRDNVLRTSQLLLTLNTDFSIKDKASGAILHRGTASADSYTVLDSNVQNSESQALEDAAQRLAGNVAMEISEGW